MGTASHTDCFDCGAPLNDEEVLMVEEWDALIHKRCLRSFLGSREAEVIYEHQHPIVVVQTPDEYLRLLCYSPELSASDWAVCAIDVNGDEVVLRSFSRVEYADGRA
jgi:hypothetical protein